MSKGVEEVFGIIILLNIGYLIWGEYDGYIPYITLFLILLVLGWSEDGKKSKEETKNTKNIKTKDKMSNIKISSYIEFKKELMFYKKEYSKHVPISKIYIDERGLDEIKDAFKDGYIIESTFDKILGEYDPIEIDLMDFEDFIKTRYFRENSLYPTKTKLKKVNASKANSEIRHQYNTALKTLTEKITSNQIREDIAREGKFKIDDINVEYLD